MDVVARNGGFAFIVADLSPVSDADHHHHHLRGEHYQWFKALNASLFEAIGEATESGQSSPTLRRPVPQWGEEIFSDGFVALQPKVSGKKEGQW